MSNTFIRRNILQVASGMVREMGSHDVQFSNVAERAGVDIDVVERNFDSRSQLIAEAQMANYFSMVEPMHLSLSRVEKSLVDGDESEFWSAVKQNMVMAWSSEQTGDKWGIVNLLLDIRSDAFSLRHFAELLDIQFSRWVDVIEAAKLLGWVVPSLDAKAFIAVFWSSSIGQVITSETSFLDPSTEDVLDLFFKVVRGEFQASSASGS